MRRFGENVGALARVPNDVIMNIVGPPLKKIAIIPEDYPESEYESSYRKIPTNKVCTYQVYILFLQYDETLRDVINETRGVVGQSNISVNQSRNLIMPIPSLQEQQEIINTLNRLIEKENSAVEMLEVKETDLEMTILSILSKAFQGELGTNNPDEEKQLSSPPMAKALTISSPGSKETAISATASADNNVCEAPVSMTNLSMVELVPCN